MIEGYDELMDEYQSLQEDYAYLIKENKRLEELLDLLQNSESQKIIDLRQEVLDERERCARIAEHGLFPFDIDIWMLSTKKEMTAHVARAIAAAIRAGI